MIPFRPASVVRAAALALAAFFVLALPARAEPKFPELTGRVVDDAHILPADTKAQIEQELADLEQKTTDQVVVVTLPSLQDYDIADYGYQLGRKWQIGQKGQNNGVLFIVAPNERKVRIEVGYGLEPVLTDALSSVILQTRVLPRFREGDYAGGVKSGVDAIVEQLTMDRGEAMKRAQAAAKPKAEINPIAIALIGFFVFFVLSSILRAFAGGGRRYHGDGGLLPILIWSMLGSGRGGGGGGWGGGGGGGFSGGGGSFGGGGASGGW
jgi:uncharacterized protein